MALVGGKIPASTNPIRTRAGSISKYSATPPATPKSRRSLRLRRSRRRPDGSGPAMSFLLAHFAAPLCCTQRATNGSTALHVLYIWAGGDLSALPDRLQEPGDHDLLFTVLEAHRPQGDAPRVQPA